MENRLHKCTVHTKSNLGTDKGTEKDEFLEKCHGGGSLSIQKFQLPYISIHTLFELLAPHSISIVKVSSATLPQGVVGWRQVTTTRRSQVSRLVAIQGVPSQSYVQRCF